MRVTPGGGLGIEGFGPHIHDGSTEIFTCISGTMTYRFGRDFGELSSGVVWRFLLGRFMGSKTMVMTC
jgi:uncharacterized cupin superfamily protein